MKTWVIGDIHGCFKTFEALCSRLCLGMNDRVISIGDLINRGPDSGKVLDFFCNDSRFSAILGNHDWAFILSYLIKKGPVHDDFRILAAQSRSSIWVDWLRQQPFSLLSERYFLVHAGCWPLWTLEEHQYFSNMLHAWFKTASVDELRILDAYLQTENRFPIDQKIEENPLRYYAVIMNVLTKIRYLSLESPLHMVLDLKGPPVNIDDAIPWFEKYPLSSKQTIVFGHWSALEGIARKGLEGIDTGCVWGGSLTALELDSGLKITQESLERRM